MRRLALLGAALAILSGGFVWGFLVHRDGVFPYELIRTLVRGHRAAAAGSVQAPAIDQKAMLASLPYVDATFDQESHLRGVVRYERGRAQEGVNFYHRARAPEARIVSMEGELLHRWSLSTRQWEHAEPLPNGDLIVVIKNQQLLRLDRDSRVLWRRRVRVHHSVDVQPSGEIHVIKRARRLMPALHPEVPVVDDIVAVFDSKGELMREISLLDRLLASPYAMLLPRVEKGRFASANEVDELDLLHANHIQVLDGSLAGQSPLFARGTMLVSLRNINTLVLLEGQAGDVLWAWGPSNLVRQHSPLLLESGNMLIFNNGLNESEVLELDPLSLRVAWRYAPGPEFHSGTRGSAQRLANGNTLITESERGYVHEVDAGGDIVWQFANPVVDAAGRREVIWSMRRLAPESVPFLSEGGAAEPPDPTRQ